MNQTLGPVIPDRKSGTEPFHHNGRSLGFDLLDFRQWSSSDLLSNTMRGLLAEYLVARALDAAERVRVEWDPFDVITGEGIRVEVKSAAYLQSWHQNALSTIRFGTRPTSAWDAAAGTFADERKRQADVYVFCLLDHKEKATVDPLNVAQWKFFVLATERLNAVLGEQKSVGLNGLRSMGAEESDYENLAGAVRRAGA